MTNSVQSLSQEMQDLSISAIHQHVDESVVLTRHRDYGLLGYNQNPPPPTSNVTIALNFTGPIEFLIARRHTVAFNRPRRKLRGSRRRCSIATLKRLLLKIP